MSFVEVRGNAGSGTIHMSSKLHRPLLDWICDHQVMGRVVCPGAAYMEMSGCVSEICNGTMGTELKSLVLDASIPMPLTLAKPFETENGLITECELSLLVDREQGDIQIRSSNAAKGGSGLHLRASIGLSLDDGLVPSSVCVSESSGPPSPELVRSQCSQSVDSTAMYVSLYAVGLQYGPRFQVVSRVSVGSEGKRVFGWLSGSSSTDESGISVSPAVLDGCMQLGVGLRDETSSSESSKDAKVPAGFSVYCPVSSLPNNTTYGIAEHGSAQSSDLVTVSSHYILDTHGSVVCKIHDLQVKPLIRRDSAGKRKLSLASEDVYRFQWEAHSFVSSLDKVRYSRNFSLVALPNMVPVVCREYDHGHDVMNLGRSMSSRLLDFISVGQAMLTSSKNLGVSYFSELNALDYCTAPATTS